MNGSDLLGRTIGRVRVVDLLGQGGMGSVYVGYDEKLDRKVALKAMRGDHRLNLEAKARFQREARVLSQLDHPNICRIYDYIEGQDADFLVLELIAGRNLKAVIHEGKASFDQKLRVAEQLLEVLAVAHGSGVIHRDIKPANIMVTETGVVKVLDFGLARSEEVRSDVSTVILSAEKSGEAQETAILERDSIFYATRLGTIMGTLAYMSPEQARGEVVTSAGDMYSCGLVLQELFTGQPPIDLTLSPQQLLVRAREAETAPVSGLGEDLTTLINRLKAPSPGVRPSAPDALERIRWVQAAPIRRRRRQAFVAGFAGLAVLSASLAVQTWRAGREAEHAKLEAETSGKVSEFLVGLFKLGDPRKNNGNTVTARELLDRGANQLQTELGNQPLVKARLQHTIGRVYEALGLYQQGTAMLESALAIREKALGPDHPDVADTLQSLGVVADSKGNYDQAEQLYKRALAIKEKALGPDHPDVADALQNLGVAADNKGNYDQAEQLYKRALAIHEKAFGPDHPDVASALHNLGQLAHAKGDYNQADQLFRRALAIYEKALGPDHPDVAMTLQSLAWLRRNEGIDVEAEQLSRRALAIREKALGLDNVDTIDSLLDLTDIVRRGGRFAEARALSERALASARDLASAATNAMRAGLEAGLLANARGDAATARGLWQEGLSRADKVTNDAEIRAVKARLLLLLGRIDEARALLGPPGYAWDVELIPLARANGIAAVEPRR